MINLCPLSDISSQIVEVFYPLSVAGTIVIPTCDTVFNHSKVFQVIREVQPTLIWGSVLAPAEIDSRPRQRWPPLSEQFASVHASSDVLAEL